MALNWIFLIGVGILLIGAIVRRQSTPPNDPEFAARHETVHLLATLFVGAAVLLAQSRFTLNTPPFYLCTVLLVPIVFAASVILKRLFRAYRQLSTDLSSHDRS